MAVDPIMGQIMVFAGAPANVQSYLPCDGRLLAISQYTALFSLLGNRYGGDGRVNFALPDLRGRTVVGGAVTDRAAAGGAESVALTAATMPAHGHSLMGYAGPADGGSSQGGAYATIGFGTAPPQPSSVPTPYGAAPGTMTQMAGLDPTMVRPAGGGAPHDNMQPFLALQFYIAVNGLYPIRP